MRTHQTLRLATCAAVTASLLAIVGTRPAAAASPDIVISEVYGGGGNSGAPFTNDFIELYNRSGAAVSVAGWSVQYAAAAGTTWQVTNLTGSIAPGARYLVQEGGGSTGAALPTPDATGGILMGAAAGKVALATSTNALTGSNPSGGTVKDLVGYGTTANGFEGGGPAPAPSNTTSVNRDVTGTDTDVNSNDFSTATPTPKAAPGASTGGGGCTPATSPPAAGTTRIRDVQGTAHLSPLAGSTVTNVPGIVTAKKSNGFYFQDASPDASDATAEGMFVFGSTIAGTVTVGASVLVTGAVQEFRPGTTTGLTITEISGSNSAITVSCGNALPAPIVIGPGGRIAPDVVEDQTVNVESSGYAYDPARTAIDFYESLEGMRVSIANPVVTGPSNRSAAGALFGELFVLPADGAGVGGTRTPRGGIVLAPSGNGKKLIVDDDVLIANGLGTLPEGTVGDHLAGPTGGPLLGVMDYNFSNPYVELTERPTLLNGGLTREVTAPTASGQLSFATFNVENLDPGDPQVKFDTLAQLIVTNLRLPDVISVQEIQDNNGATAGGEAADQTIAKLLTAISTASGVTYSSTQIDPAPGNTDGGEPNGNIRQVVLYRTDRGVALASAPAGGSTDANSVVLGTGGLPHLALNPGRLEPSDSAFSSSRKPLAVELTQGGNTYFVIANHLNSKGGDEPIYGPNQPPNRSSETQRAAQATIIRDFVRQLLAADPNANVLEMGDINDFETSGTISILEDGGAMRALVKNLPASERYSYNFDGNAQTLDHILVSQHLLSASDLSFDVVHTNSEFPAPPANGVCTAPGGLCQVSDHDPSVVRFSPAALGGPAPVVPDVPIVALAPIALAASFALTGLATSRRRRARARQT